MWSWPSQGGLRSGLMPKIHPCPRYAEPVQPEARRLHPYYFKRLKEQK
jgi:hypothetical protein